MKLEDKMIIVVQIYPGRRFGTVIGSNDGLIGILLNSGEYIDVPQERLRVIVEGVEKNGKIRLSDIHKKCPYCGMTFPPDSGSISCSCKDHGRLFAVGMYYHQKAGGGSGGKK